MLIVFVEPLRGSGFSSLYPWIASDPPRIASGVIYIKSFQDFDSTLLNRFAVLAITSLYPWIASDPPRIASGVIYIKSFQDFDSTLLLIALFHFLQTGCPFGT